MGEGGGEEGGQWSRGSQMLGEGVTAEGFLRWLLCRGDSVHAAAIDTEG